MTKNPHEPPLLTRSQLARMIDNPRNVHDRKRRVFGVVIHTTGRTKVQQAVKLGVDALQFLVDYYATIGNNAAHYVVGYDGTIVQIADERERMAHAGFRDQRSAYLDGSWVDQLPASLVTRWRARWPGVESPAHLFPGRSVNDVYVGIEMLPRLRANRFGYWYTDEQHDAVKALVADIAERWRFEPAGPRLITHSDVNPITRHDDKGGWDPGILRARPRFDWARLIA